jgi:hypothetical protein
MFQLMAKPWVLDQFAAAWWVKVILGALDNYGDVRIPPILASRCPSFRRVHEIVGLSLQPANQYGLREWSIRPGLEARLLGAGFDPKTKEIVDTHKYQVECSRIDQQAKIKKARKLEKQMAASTQVPRANGQKLTEGMRFVSNSTELGSGPVRLMEREPDPFRLYPSTLDEEEAWRRSKLHHEGVANAARWLK